jgi:hypothetical protein
MSILNYCSISIGYVFSEFKAEIRGGVWQIKQSEY